MKNFTRSVLYSTTVLAAGLVAIFAIYNNVSTSEDGRSMANISPAAGESTLGVNFGEAVINSAASMVKEEAERTPEAIQSAMEDSAEALNNMVSAAGQELPETAVEAINAAKDDIEEDAVNVIDTAE